MKIEELLHHLESGAEMTVANAPFSYGGHAEITLEGGDIRHWLYARDGEAMLSIAVDDEELIFFETLEEELEPEGGMILLRGNEHEFTYEDVGTVTKAEGDIVAEEEDQFRFADYEADGGQLVRLVTNQNTGDTHAYLGTLVVEEDILNVS